MLKDYLAMRYDSSRETYPPRGFIEIGRLLSDVDEIIESKVKFAVEMLREPNLSWVDDFVYDVLNTDNDSAYYLEKYKVYVVFEPPANDYSFINSAGYNSENQLFILRLRNDVDRVSKFKEIDFIREVKDFIVHEDTYKQQDQLDSNKQLYCDDPSKYLYFTQYEEVAPFAREIAHAIKSRTNLGNDEIIEAIIKNNAILSVLPEKEKYAIKAYKYIGGKSLKRFLAKVYRYLYPDPFKLGLAEYRKWLKEHE